MAQVIAIGEAVNDEERRAIAWLKDKLPADYTVIHSFEVEQYNQKFEVDICVVAPHAIYLVDAKGIHGKVEVDGNTWHTQHNSYRSPLPKLRGNAKSLSGLIARQNRSNRSLKNIYVDTAVLLTLDGCEFSDPDDRERGHVVALKNSTRFFTDASRIPDRFVKNVTKYIRIITETLGKSAKQRNHGLRYGNWEMAEQLQLNEVFTEYRAFNFSLGRKSGSVLVRAYKADPYLPEAERTKQKRLLENAYRALMQMPAHSAIVGAKDFFSSEAQDRYLLLTDDIPGELLADWLSDPARALTLDQKKRIVRDLLSALVHLSTYGVVHRNITPSHILFGLDGQPRLMDFDFAHIGTEQSTTIADEVQARVSSRYKAPELWADPYASSYQSDLYSLGLVVYELFTGEVAFDSVTQAIDRSCQFSRKVSESGQQLPHDLDDWLARICHNDVTQRPTAEQALLDFDALWKPKSSTATATKSDAAKPKITQPSQQEAINYRRLKPGYQLTNKYIVQQPLGKPGGFGIVYKVTDTFGDVSRAVKLILNDRESVLERLKQEYRTLIKLPVHPYVVKVYDADVLPNNGPPYIVFEYLDGLDVGELISERKLTAHEVWTMAKQVVEGLQHLHNHTIYHCDIKPQNLIWKDGRVRIIDFNVSVDAADLSHGGGSRKYLPPDLDMINPPEPNDLVDRDLYALGITLYRAMTGEYPWANVQMPPSGEPARNPNEFRQSMDLSDDVCALLLKLIAPYRTDRFASAEQLHEEIERIQQLKKPFPKDRESTSQFRLPPLADGSTPNQSAFHDYLLTLYSQSKHSNSGTRGLDDYARLIYVETALDTKLAPAVLAGQLKLVVITGNAGDGKTAFLQQLETEAKQQGAQVELNETGNGSEFELNGHRYLSNYDGSQDEGDKDNEIVLQTFLAPFKGDDQSAWPHHETRLIAINEGRLIDFLSSHGDEYAELKRVVTAGLQDGTAQADVAVINLNLRDVLACTDDQPQSIFERLIDRMVNPELWQGCDYCTLKEKCYVKHNVATFQNTQVGSKVVERLEHLYRLTTLKNQLHITMRDLRSALAYMLVGDRACNEINALYANGDVENILHGYYFNAWRDGQETQDRLLSLLQDVDVARGVNVRLDRGLDFLGLRAVDWLTFDERSDHDQVLLEKQQQSLPSDTRLSDNDHRFSHHRHLLQMLRRRAYFEQRSADWQQMLTHHSANQLLAYLCGEASLDQAKQQLVYAINRGEGLHRPDYFHGQLVMQVRKVAKGTIKSFRVFPSELLSLEIKDAARNSDFIEHSPSAMVLKYCDSKGLKAELEINLDLFEMLQRLNQGYVPSFQETQGYYLSLSVFKNVLASAPYQEVLLTRDGRHYQKITRKDDGVLLLTEVNSEVSA